MLTVSAHLPSHLGHTEDELDDTLRWLAQHLPEKRATTIFAGDFTAEPWGASDNDQLIRRALRPRGPHDESVRRLLPIARGDHACMPPIHSQRGGQTPSSMCTNRCMSMLARPTDSTNPSGPMLAGPTAARSPAKPHMQRPLR